MPRAEVTARTVESLKPPPPRQQPDYWDDSLPGFGGRVPSIGTRSGFVPYRYNRRVRRHTLANVAELANECLEP